MIVCTSGLIFAIVQGRRMLSAKNSGLAQLKAIASLFAVIISLIPAAPCSARDPAPFYAVAVLPTPVLNMPDFAAVFGGRGGKSLRSDGCGQVREAEFVALPGTAFRIEETLSRNGIVVYRVSTDDYPFFTTKGYFIDSRFVLTTDRQPRPRPRHLPAKEAIIANLLAAQGSRYVWGGNVRGGVPEQLRFFPPGGGLDPATADRWQLKGLDCSGLLYEATDGFTSRNTYALVDYGAPVPIAGLAATEIIRLVEPLDLIVWQGHVMIILDRERLIESRLDCTGKRDGVRVRPLREALGEISKSRVPVNDYPAAAARGVKGFVIRRWYGRAGAIPQ
jgi:hypothetical protein